MNLTIAELSLSTDTLVFGPTSAADYAILQLLTKIGNCMFSHYSSLTMKHYATGSADFGTPPQTHLLN